MGKLNARTTTGSKQANGNPDYQKAISIIEECEKECFFIKGEEQNECDFCPTRDKCQHLADEYVANIGSASIYTLEGFKKEFSEIQKLKHESKSKEKRK